MRQQLPTVCIVDDEKIVCNGLRFLLESAGLRTLSFVSATQYLDRFDASLPGCVLVDNVMPGMCGLDLLKRLVAKGRHPPVIMISGQCDVPTAVRAMKIGAVDVLLKPFKDEILIGSLQRAIAIDAQQRERDLRIAEINERLNRLTPRERQVFEQVITGKLNKHIADYLGVSVATIQVHRLSLMRKLEANHVSQLVRMKYALEQ